MNDNRLTKWQLFNAIAAPMWGNHADRSVITLTELDGQKVTGKITAIIRESGAAGQFLVNMIENLTGRKVTIYVQTID